jgi:tetratricopeptide (TPR) repeat protein
LFLRITLLLGSPFLFLLALEVVLRLGGFGYAPSLFLPEKIGGSQMMVINDRFTRRFLGREMERKPFPAAFPETKADGTVRIFVLGESAAYGDPQPEFGLARMLGALLSGKYPHTRFEVINAAMTAINSHVVLPAARDCANQEGDIWVLYMGNNEVVGPFGAGTVFGSQAARLPVIRLSLALKKFRCVQLLDNLIASLTKRPGSRKEWGGMAMFLKNQVRQDDPRMKSVYANFERNLWDLVARAQQYGVKLVVGTVVSNLKDCAPFASLHKPGLNGSELAEWNKLYENGIAAQQHAHWTEAAGFFQQASRIDDSFADLQFAWGHCCLAQGQQAEALVHLTRARDEDALRFRADSRLNEITRTTASDREGEGIGLVDAAQIVAQQSSNHIAGDEFLYEHVHLNFDGNYLLARAFAEEASKVLPALSAGGTNDSTSWPSALDCAKRLGWTDWDRYEAASAIFRRITDAPFTGQSNHRQQAERMQLLLDRLRSASDPAGIRRAEQECQSALARFPEDWVLRKELGLLHERLGEYGLAADCWREVVKSVPQYAEGWQAFGRALAQQKQDAEARVALEQALHLEPDSPEALTALAELLAREAKHREAIDCYERVLKLKPYWGPAHWGLAKSLETLGRAEDAQPHFRQALQNRIYTPAALKGLAKLCFDRGWLSEAATNFIDALKLEPFDAATEVNLGVTLAMLGRNKEAQGHYAEALRLDPNLAEAHVRLGFELGRQGEDGEALQHFAKAVQLRPDLLEARLDLGIALVNQHRELEALEQFQEVLKHNPTNAIALKYSDRLSRNR